MCNIYKDSLLETKLINIDSKEIFSVDSHNDFGEYKVFAYHKNMTDEIIYLLDLKNNKLSTYNNIEEKIYGSFLYNDESDKILLTNSQLLKYGEKIEYNGYKFDYTSCEDGLKVYSEKDKLLSDECYGNFNKTSDGTVYVYKLEGNTKNKYLVNNKLIDKQPVGEYFIENNYSGNIKIYNKKNKEVNNTCKNKFSYYRNGLYECDDGTNSYLVNNKFKKVTDNYDYVSCSETYCKVSKNSQYGLLYNDNIIIEPKYQSIDFFGNVIIAEDEYKIDVFTLGNKDFLSEKELNKEFKDYENINIDEIITTYELNDIEDIIKDNSELFKKYAYVTINNNGLNGYKEYVLRLFKMVADNNEYLEENKLISYLKKLDIIINPTILENNHAGEYQPGSSFIYLVDPNEEWVIYHELTHFVDDAINDKEKLELCNYNNEYILKSECDLLPNEEKEKITTIDTLEFNFLIEGGAEANKSIYFTDMLTYSYSFQVGIYDAFSYIYSSEFMKDAFFGNNSDYLLFEKMVNAGYSYEEINKFERITSAWSKEYNSQNKIYCLDMLIKLYEKEKNTKWYEDETFYLLIKNMLPDDFESCQTDRYDEYLIAKKNNNINYLKNITSELGNKYEITISKGTRYYDNKMYFIYNVREEINSYIKYGYIVVDYDIENKKINDYKFIAL